MGVDRNLWKFRKGGRRVPKSNKCEQGGKGSKVWLFCDNVITECPQCNFSSENLQLWKFVLKCGNYGCIRTTIICIFHWLQNKENSSHKPFFFGIATLFLLSLLWRSRFLKKKKKTIFPGLKSLYLFQSGLNNSVKIWTFDATTRGISR